NIRGSGLLKRRWLYHAAFWLYYYILTLVLYLSIHQHVTARSCLFYLVVLFTHAGLAYLNIYVLIPRLLFARKFGYYILCLAVGLTVCTYIMLGEEWIYGYLDVGGSVKR